LECSAKPLGKKEQPPGFPRGKSCKREVVKKKISNLESVSSEKSRKVVRTLKERDGNLARGNDILWGGVLLFYLSGEPGGGCTKNKKNE